MSAYNWAEPIREELEAVEARLRQVPDNQEELLVVATGRLLDAGGKRVRPAMCLLAAGMFGVDFERAVSLAAGVEMLHTATLVHDDLIDDAQLRRGAPTLNADRSPSFTVLAGDYLFARAASLVARTDNVSTMDLFAKTLMVILNGEIAQRASKWQVDRQEYERRIYAKTAALFVLTTHAAAVLGGADDASTQLVIEFGRSAGMAFQIVDDVLDFIGDASRMGKLTGSDLRQGLFTLPVIYYAEAHPEDPDLITVLEAKDDNHPAIERVVRSVCNSAAVEKSLHEARGHVSAAQQAIRSFRDSVYVDALTDLAGSVVERNF
jgi:geranylgeranyl pyrophosphate synthase